MNEDKRWSPAKDTITVVFINMGVAVGLVAATWALMSGKITLSQVQTITLFAAGLLLIGILTYIVAVNRPWWPRTALAKESERTRRRVEREWGTAIRLAQKITIKLDKEVQRRAKSTTETETKNLVLNRLSRQTVKTTKAAMTLIQAGFPEAAFSAWRTIFEIWVNAQYIECKNPKVAERFIEAGLMNHLSRVAPESNQLQRMKDRWKSKQLKPENQHGWTGNPPKDLSTRAEEVGIESESGRFGRNELEFYRLANSFVHADWISTSESIGDFSPEITDGAAEGAGEILYIVLETATKIIQLTAPEELREELDIDIWNLRTEIKGAPERLRGKFIRLPLTEPIAILPDGRVAIATIKRREEWPKEADARTRIEVEALMAEIERAEGDEADNIPTSFRTS